MNVYKRTLGNDGPSRKKKNLLLTVRAVDGNSVIDEIYVYLSFQRSEATFLSEFTQYNSSIDRDRLT